MAKNKLAQLRALRVTIFRVTRFRQIIYQVISSQVEKKIEKILSVRFSLHREGKIIPSRHSLNTNTIIRLGTILPFILSSFHPCTKSSPVKLQKY